MTPPLQDQDRQALNIQWVIDLLYKHNFPHLAESVDAAAAVIVSQIRRGKDLESDMYKDVA